MKIFIRNKILAISGIATGITGGFLYYYFIGCRTGSCAITSSPWLSMIWGGAMGFLVFDLFRKKKVAVSEKDDNQS
jgi:hypothetical protein